ncbi:MAG: nucleoside recognition domain-containing protein [Verrucomicrobiota bacterium]
MLNGLWLGLILISIFLGGFTGRLEAVTNGAFSAAKDAITGVALPLAGMMGLWLGLLRLAERSGLVEALARTLHPVTRMLFPEVPEGHPAMGAMVLNMAANMLGLGNAATPLGLKAMRSLETLNPHPGVATNAMCTFLAINTSSIQLVPATAIAILAAQGSRQPTAILATALLASLIAAIVGITAVKLLQRLPVFRIRPEHLTPQPATEPLGNNASHDSDPAPSSEVPPKPLTKAGILLLGMYCCLFALLACMLLFPTWFTPVFDNLSKWSSGFLSLSVPPLPEALENQTGLPKLLGVLSLLAVPFLIGFFVLSAAVRGVKVYEEFVSGAKEGPQVALRIVPYLTAIVDGVRMFREAGAVELVSRALSPVLQPLGISADLLPLILVRPLSGSATTGLFTELVTKFGPDSLIARTAATIFGSTETTFYVLAVYFGSVGIRRGRHALATGLIADATGAVASIAICRWIFA